MSRSLLFSLLMLFITGCTNSTRLNVFMENSSELKHEIIVETFLGKVLIDKRRVVKGNKNIKWESFVVHIPENKDSVSLTFKVANSALTTTCCFSVKQITSNTWMHVNLHEVLFKKGYEIAGKVLNKDTIIESKFYCELVDQPR